MQKLNQYETQIIHDLKVVYDGDEYKGLELIGKIVIDNSQGNYKFYNILTGGIGKQSPIGNLLAKIGVE